MDYQMFHIIFCHLHTWAWVITAICQWMKIRSTIVASTPEISWAIWIPVTVSFIYSTLIWAWATFPLTSSCPITWASPISCNFQKYIMTSSLFAFLRGKGSFISRERPEKLTSPFNSKYENIFMQTDSS